MTLLPTTTHLPMAKRHMTNSPLPPTPPQDPVRLLGDWLADATQRSGQRLPNAFALATADAAGQPSARMVLLKDLSLTHGYAVFHTNYRSRKGAELDRRAQAAAVLHWDRLGRQVRLEGPAVRCPAEESDAYFATRPWQSRLNAWVSDQSHPLGDPAELAVRARQQAEEFNLPDPAGPASPTDSAEAALVRPPFWGGYRLWFTAMEFWTEGTDRFHERVRYERTLAPAGNGAFTTGPWSWQRLQP